MKRIALLIVALAGYTGAQAQITDEEVHNTIAVNIGEGVSYYMLTFGQLTTDLTIDYDCNLWGKFGLGANVQYSMLRKNHDRFDRKFDNLFYIGPCATFSHYTELGWRWHASAGIGYAAYLGDYSGSDWKGGLGYKIKYGIDYLITDHFGIGVEINGLGTVIRYQKHPSKVDDYWVNEACIIGDLSIGARVYF